MNKIEIANRIRKKRKQLINERGKPLTQEELANIIDIDVQTINKYESLKENKNTIPSMRVEFLYELALALGASTDWLLGLKNSEEISAEDLTLKQRFGLTSKAITKLSNIVNLDFGDDSNSEFVEKRISLKLNQYDYLNALIESEYFFDFFKSVSRYTDLNFSSYCLRDNVLEYAEYNHEEGSICNKEEDDILVYTALDRYDDMVSKARSEKLRCFENTEKLVEDISSKLHNKRINLLYDDADEN